MKEQRRVAAFVEENGLEAPPEFRLLDLVSELGEVAKDAAESTDYGDDPGALAVQRDELGDALFSLLALADALAKYARRMESWLTVARLTVKAVVYAQQSCSDR